MSHWTVRRLLLLVSLAAGSAAGEGWTMNKMAEVYGSSRRSFPKWPVSGPNPNTDASASHIGGGMSEYYGAGGSTSINGKNGIYRTRYNSKYPGFGKTGAWMMQPSTKETMDPHDAGETKDMNTLATKLWASSILRDNMVTVFGYLITLPSNPLETDQYTALFHIYDVLRFRRLQTVELVPYLKEMASASPTDQFKILFREMKKICPVYLKSSVQVWINSLNAKTVDVDSIIRPGGGPLTVDFLAGIEPSVLGILNENVQFKNDTVNSASSHITETLGPLMSYTFSAIVDGTLPMTQTLFALLLLHRPLNYMVPEWIETERYLIDVLSLNNVENWEEIISKSESSRQQNPYTYGRAILGEISEMHELDRSLRDAAALILSFIKAPTATYANVHYNYSSAVMSKPTIDILVILRSINSYEYPDDVVDAKNRLQYYILAGYLDMEFIIKGFNRFDHAKPINLLIAILTRIEMRLPKLPHEIMSSVKYLKVYLVFKKFLCSMSAKIPQDFFENPFLLNSFAGPNMPAKIRNIVLRLSEQLPLEQLPVDKLIEQTPIEECSRPRQCILHMYRRIIDKGYLVGKPVLDTMVELVTSLDIEGNPISHHVPSEENKSAKKRKVCRNKLKHKCPFLKGTKVKEPQNAEREQKSTSSYDYLAYSNWKTTPKSSNNYSTTPKTIKGIDDDYMTTLPASLTKFPKYDKKSKSKKGVKPNALDSEGSEEKDKAITGDIDSSTEYNGNITAEWDGNDTNTSSQGKKNRGKIIRLQGQEVQPDATTTLSYPVDTYPDKKWSDQQKRWKQQFSKLPQEVNTLPPTSAFDSYGYTDSPRFSQDKAIAEAVGKPSPDLIYAGGDTVTAAPSPIYPGPPDEPLLFPIVNKTVEAEVPDYKHPEEILPRTALGTPEDIKMRPLRMFLSQPNLYDLLGKGFRPHVYLSKGKLVRAILKKALTLKHVQYDVSLRNTISQYLMFLEYSPSIPDLIYKPVFAPVTRSFENEYADPKEPLKLLPIAIPGTPEYVKLEPLRRFFSDANLYLYLGPDFRPKIYLTKGKLLRAIMRRAIMLPFVRNNIVLYITMKQYLKHLEDFEVAPFQITKTSFPKKNPVLDHEPANWNHLETLLPMTQPGTPEHLKLRPLRLFLSQPDFMQLMGPEFHPEKYNTKGGLLKAILNYCQTLKFVKYDKPLYNLMTEYLEFIQGNGTWGNNTSSVGINYQTIVKALPLPQNEYEEQMLALIRQLLEQPQFYHQVIKNTIDLENYKTRGEVLKQILVKALESDTVKKDKSLESALHYFKERVFLEGYGGQAVDYVIFEEKTVDLKFDVFNVFRAINHEKLDAEGRAAVNRLIHFVSLNFDPTVYLANFDFEKYHAKGEFLKEAFKHMLSQNTVSPKLKADMLYLIPYIMNTGPGAEAVDFEPEEEYS